MASLLIGKRGASADSPSSPKDGAKEKSPPALKNLVDDAMRWFQPPGKPSALRIILVIALIPGAMFIRGLLTYLNAYFLSWVGIRALNDLRARLFAHLMEMPMSFFSTQSTGNLMAQVEATNALNGTINGSFATIIREPISVIVLIAALIALQPRLSLGAFLVFPICLLPVIIYGRKLRKTHSSIHSKLAGLSMIMHESFTGARIIKAYNLETTVVGEFRRAAQAVTSYYMRSVRASELPGPLIELIGSIGVALALVYFAFFATGRAPVGDLLSFFMVVFSLYQPIKNLSRLHSQLTMARAAMDPVYALLGTPSPLVEPARPKPVMASEGSIHFEHVSFSYGEKLVLNDINLAIHPGQLVALVGSSGSGKTTLTSLLLRFYDPKAGAVRIGGTDIREVLSRELRANIAVVTQETVLFNETIRHNIALGRPGATDAEIEDAARHAHALDFIQEKKDGFNMIVGEKGAMLSGGQRQRIAIARAILKKAPILILDEATSSLDTESERAVQLALDELMQGRTTICIAHRLSTIQKADLIVVLEQGRIVETGTHAELLAHGRVYRKLHDLQFNA